jgi:hypothetical protein
MSKKSNLTETPEDAVEPDAAGLRRLREFEEIMKKIDNISPPSPKVSIQPGLWCNQKCKRETHEAEENTRNRKKTEEGIAIEA